MRRLTIAAVVFGLAISLAAYAARPGDSPEPKAERPQVGNASESAAPQRQTWGPTPKELERARRQAAKLSLRQLAGQLIVARHISNQNSLSLVRKQHFAGVMVTGERILDLSSPDPLRDVIGFNRQLRDAGRKRGLPVMIPIDQEGGLVARLKAPLTEFPTFMSAGAAIAGDRANGPGLVRDAARASGSELKAAGFNTVFAPGADLTIGPADPIIGSRAAGSKPQVVSSSARAAVEGYSQAGMISTLKHYPGHRAKQDSHTTLPKVTTSLNQLRKRDLAPFAAGIDAGAPGVMTGHLQVTALDRRAPSSMSRTIVTGELRDRMRFDGLVITDSLGMGAVVERYRGGRAAVQAIKAGNDLALMPADNEAAYAAVLNALKSGEIPRKQARASAARTIAWLRTADAADPKEGKPGSHNPESKNLSAAALTVVSGPCRPERARSFRPYGPPDLVRAFTRAARAANVGVDSGPSVTLLGYGTRGGTGDIVVTTDRPYPLKNSRARQKIALYGGARPAMSALVDFLTGKSTAPGDLPVREMTAAGCAAKQR